MKDETDFPVWLSAQLMEHGWSRREIARRAGVSHTWVTNVLNGKSEPTANFCVAIAKGIALPAEYVMRQAGILTNPGSESPHVLQCIQRIKAMDQSVVKLCLLILDALLEIEEVLNAKV